MPQLIRVSKHASEQIPSSTRTPSQRSTLRWCIERRPIEDDADWSPASSSDGAHATGWCVLATFRCGHRLARAVRRLAVARLFFESPDSQWTVESLFGASEFPTHAGGAWFKVRKPDNPMARRPCDVLRWEALRAYSPHYLASAEDSLGEVLRSRSDLGALDAKGWLINHERCMLCSRVSEALRTCTY